VVAHLYRLHLCGILLDYLPTVTASSRLFMTLRSWHSSLIWYFPAKRVVCGEYLGRYGDYTYVLKYITCNGDALILNDCSATENTQYVRDRCEISSKAVTPLPPLPSTQLKVIIKVKINCRWMVYVSIRYGSVGIYGLVDHSCVCPRSMPCDRSRPSWEREHCRE
jgi:hypothetical protein